LVFFFALFFATAFAGRTARFDLSADTGWDDATEDDRQRAWVREAMAIVEPDAIEGRYANENADAGKPNGKNMDLAASYGADLKKHGFPQLGTFLMVEDGSLFMKQEFVELDMMSIDLVAKLVAFEHAVEGWG
jgi:hypothetical protein